MSLKKTWNQQYDGKKISSLKDKNLYFLEVKAIISCIHKIIKNFSKNREEFIILELGCGTGELLKQIDNNFKNLSNFNINPKYVGVDFSINAINQAKKNALENQTFRCEDFLNYLVSKEPNSIDIIVTQRAIMAIMDQELQNQILYEINRVLKEDGAGIFSECFNSGLNNLNQLRELAKLGPIEKVWHSLYLEEENFFQTFEKVDFYDFCSTYFLITRIIYPYFDTPNHNQTIHDIAAKFPNSGTNSFLKLVQVAKKIL